jgi:hypothetical protein
MHKEEFYKTLLEDRFISFLIKQTKINAIEGKIEEILKLIDNLEFDSFPNSSNKLLIENNPKKEMTRFSSFLDLQLKEIIERQNALEKQIQSIKENNNMNNLNNLNKLLEKNGDDFFIKKTESTLIKLNSSSDENSIKKIDILKSHSIMQECNHHFHSNLNNLNSLTSSHELLHRECKCKLIHKCVNTNINNTSNIIKYDSKTENITNNSNFNIKYKNPIQKNSKNIINNQEKDENFTIDDLVNYIETNNNDNKSKKNKKKTKNSKKKNENKKESPTKNKNERHIDESVVDNFKKKIQNDSSFAENVRKIKPILSIKWLKSINNKIE